MNKVFFVGNIVSDAEITFVGQNGTAKARFTLAINERLGKDNEKVNYIPCVVWGKMAEGLGDYLVKGIKVAVSGRLDIDKVAGEYEGEYKTFVNVNVSDLDFCSSKKQEQQEQQPQQQKQRPKQQQKQRPKQQQKQRPQPVDADGDAPF